LPGSTQSAPDSALPTGKPNLSMTAGMFSPVLSSKNIRTEKIAALQRAIAAGTYHVSSSDMAGELINALLKERT